MRIIRMGISIMIIFMMLLSLIPTNVLASDKGQNIIRLHGQDRITTAIAICEEGWKEATTIILAPANQENLVDGLMALSLAGREKAPILLTDKNRLHSRVLNKIKQLQTQKIYMVGALSARIVENLKMELAQSNPSIHIEVIKGKDRHETGQKIRSIMGIANNELGAFIIGAYALSDALSAGPFAYAHGYTYSFASGLRVSTHSYVTERNEENRQAELKYILGGPSIGQNIPGSTRIGGKDRYETNKAIIEQMNFNTHTIYIANGSDHHLADALAGAALAGKTGSPIYFTDGSGQGLTDLLKEKLNTGSSIVILGGPAAISEESRMRITGVVNEESSGSGTGTSNETDLSRQITVNSIEHLNLLQFAVEFNRHVNRQSVENVENYIVNGKNLSKSTAVADLQSDGKTVVITLNTPQVQYSTVLVEVKEHRIFSDDRSSTVPGYEGYITMSDITEPEVNQVTPEGSRKLTVQFSEAVELSDVIFDYDHHQWQFDGQNLTTKGLQKVKIVNSIKVNGRTYGTGLEFHFGVSMCEGNHIFKIPSMDSVNGGSQLFRDGAGYVLSDQTFPFTVQGVSGNPTVQVEKTEGNSLYLMFDRPMYSHPDGSAADRSDPASVLNPGNYEVNSSPGSILSTEFAAGSDRKVVKLQVNPNQVYQGVNVVSVNKRVLDLYGLRLVEDSEGEDVRLLFTTEPDKVKPQVEKAVVISSNVIRVTFSEKVNGLYASNKNNYVLKNSDGATVPIQKITAVPDSNITMYQGVYPCTNIYEIQTGEPLYSSTYTLKITTIQDMALRPNTIDESSILDTKNYLFKDGSKPSEFM